MENWKAPHASVYDIFSEANDQINILIGGNVGSGKSVFEEGMIYNLVNEYTPDEVELYLVDPKRVELVRWTVLPHVRGYAKDAETALRLLDMVIYRMMDRYDEMAQNGDRKYPGSHIYVFIDEMADMMLEDKKATTAKLQKIMQLGRAANVHMVCCSQSVSRLTIPAAAQINFTCRIGLRTDDGIDSRQVVKQMGCEKLNVGECIMKTPEETVKRPVPMYTESHINAMRQYWMLERGQKGARR